MEVFIFPSAIFTKWGIFSTLVVDSNGARLDISIFWTTMMLIKISGQSVIIKYRTAAKIYPEQKWYTCSSTSFWTSCLGCLLRCTNPSVRSILKKCILLTNHEHWARYICKAKQIWSILWLENVNGLHQCCRSGSGVGFGRIRNFLPDPE